MDNRKLLSLISILLLLWIIPAPLFSQGRVAGTVVMERTLDTSTGDIFFVDDSGSDEGASDGSITAPFATLDYAIGRTSASVGDTIFLMEGHAETLIAADGVDVDVAGIKIIGLGTGNLRATFTMATNAAAEINIDAANVYLANIIIVDNIACTACIELTANADGFHMNNVLIREGSQQPAIMLDMVGQADDVLIENSVFYVPTADTGNIGIDISALTPARFTFRNNVVRGDFNTAAFFGSGALTDAYIHDNVFENLLAGQYAFELSAASLGILADNYLASDSILTALDPGSLKSFGNRWNSNIDSSSGPIPTPNDIFFPGFGYKVTKNVDLSSDPDAAFDIVGSVLITRLVAEVTTVVATTTGFSLETTTGSIALFASTTITTDPDGTMYIACGDKSVILNGATAPSLELATCEDTPSGAWYVGREGGTEVIRAQLNAAGTGIIAVTIWYVPVLDGSGGVPASVVASS